MEKKKRLLIASKLLMRTEENEIPLETIPVKNKINNYFSNSEVYFDRSQDIVVGML